MEHYDLNTPVSIKEGRMDRISEANVDRLSEANMNALSAMKNNERFGEKTPKINHENDSDKPKSYKKSMFSA